VNDPEVKNRGKYYNFFLLKSTDLQKKMTTACSGRCLLLLFEKGRRNAYKINKIYRIKGVVEESLNF
jgi:hypothetical protein